MRLAIYYAPGPTTALHELGSHWLGRDAFSGRACVQPVVPGVAEITAEPRRYGFHATLKPPFTLKDEFSPAALEAAVEVLADSFQPFEITLMLRQIDGFLALVPDGSCKAIDDLAMACVRDLDAFRQPITEAELARRRSAGLSARQDGYLARWGYPHVFEDFRFHMTLSRLLSPSEMQDVWPAAKDHFAAVLGRPVTVDALTMFLEPQSGADFEAQRRFPFRSSQARAAP